MLRPRRRSRRPPLPAIDAVRAIGKGLTSLSRRLQPAPIPLLEIVSGHWRVHALGAIARLGVADRLAAGPREVGDLAREVGAHEDSLFRVLRALASDGILDRPAPRTFALNAISEPLCRDHPRSIHHTVVQITSEWSQRAWAGLGETVRDGAPAFMRVFGSDLWTYFQAHPDEGQDFHRSMLELSRLDVPDIVAAFDFGPYPRIVDVGGGSGQLLGGVLAAYPSARGVLYDTEAATREAPEVLQAAGVQDRVAIEIGDFYRGVPGGHDLYLLRQIVHGHSDAQLAPILSGLRAALSPRARLLVLDTLVPEDRRGPHPAFLDLQMLVGSGGRERSRSEMESLLAGSGLRLLSVHRTPGPTAIFEAALA